MIFRVQLCYAHAMKLKGPSEIGFVSGLNVLIGPNGSGKSTVLRALYECDRCRIEKSGVSGVQYFNAETMNPHTPNGPPGDIRNMILRTRGIFSSHGEIMKSALTSLPLRRGATLLVDEPESGQDVGSVQRIRQGLDSICRKGGQVIAATHHPFLLQNAHIIELVPGYAEELRETYRKSVCRTTSHECYETGLKTESLSKEESEWKM
jgi:Fe-S cluster assembly ATPase SufC